MRLIALSHAAILAVNRELFAELARRGHHVLIVVPARWRNDFGREPLRPVPLRQAKSSTLHLEAFAVAAMGKTAVYACVSPRALALAHWKPDVVFTDEEPWSPVAVQGALLAQLTGAINLIYTKENRRRSYPFGLHALRRFALGSAAHILAISQTSRQLLNEDGYSNVTEFPHAVDTRLFTPVTHQKQADVITHLGFVGRLVPEKGVENLLQAFAHIARELPRTHLHIYGAGRDQYVQALRRLQETLGIDSGTLTWHGAVSHADAPSAYHTLDLLVVPTVAHNGYAEQFGRVVIEAMACGVPVIASDNGELPRLIATTHGGIIFPQGNTDELAAAIKRLLVQREQRYALTEAGLRHVRAVYTYPARTDTLLEVLHRYL